MHVYTHRKELASCMSIPTEREGKQTLPSFSVFLARTHTGRSPASYIHPHTRTHTHANTYVDAYTHKYTHTGELREIICILNVSFVHA